MFVRFTVGFGIAVYVGAENAGTQSLDERFLGLPDFSRQHYSSIEYRRSGPVANCAFEAALWKDK